MTLKETILEELQNLLDELEEDEDSDADEIKALVKARLEATISLLDDE